MPLYVLNDSVSIEGDNILIDDTPMFECNEDALDMLKVMYDFKQLRKPFGILDIMECLDIEKTDDNIFAVQNAIYYLKGCFMISEY